MFTIDPMPEAKKIQYPIELVGKTTDIKGRVYTDRINLMNSNTHRRYGKKISVYTDRINLMNPEDAVKDLILADTLIEQLGIPLTRFDFAAINYLYHTQGREVFQGGIADYSIFLMKKFIYYKQLNNWQK